jgi:predicted DNA-binding protein
MDTACSLRQRRLCGEEAGMSDTMVSTVRLPREMATALSAVARADEMPVSEAIREAVDRHIASRRADHAFQERLKKCLDEDREVLELLAE